MDENKLKNVIATFKSASIEMFAFLSKDKKDKWTVTRQIYSMSGDELTVTERITKVEHTISNKIVIPNLDNYEPGQKIFGTLLEDGTYHISSICVDTKIYDI